MASVNKYIVVGHLGKDPELEYTSGGTAFCKFSVATNNSFKDKEGNKKEEVDWHNIVTWGKTAENCKQYLAKGRLVYVEGRHRTNEWEKDGVKHYRSELIAQTVTFLGGGKEGGSSGGKSSSRDDGPPPMDDSDIPF